MPTFNYTHFKTCSDIERYAFVKVLVDAGIAYPKNRLLYAEITKDMQKMHKSFNNDFTNVCDKYLKDYLELNQWNHINQLGMSLSYAFNQGCHKSSLLSWIEVVSGKISDPAAITTLIDMLKRTQRMLKFRDIKVYNSNLDLIQNLFEQGRIPSSHMNWAIKFLNEKCDTSGESSSIPSTTFNIPEVASGASEIPSMVFEASSSNPFCQQETGAIKKT